jgi:hypothetical protein
MPGIHLSLPQRPHATQAPRPGRRRRLSLLLALLVVASLAGPLAPSLPDVERAALASGPGAPPVVAVHPFVYAMASSSNTYDIMWSNGGKKDPRVARIKVDSIFFSDATAALSTDGTHAAFRVTGDRYGGSSLYSVGVIDGEYAQIAASKNSAHGIGSYAWSPAGNTLAYVMAAPALDPAQMDDAYGTIHIWSAGFEPVRLPGSNGSDRLLGFSSDGFGVYAARRETRVNQMLEHLVYIPLSGAEATVLLRSRPELRYTRYAVWSPPGSLSRVAYLAEGDWALAAGNSNVSEVLPALAGQVRPTSKAPGSDKLAKPSSFGLVVSDMAGVEQVLLRRDAEPYTHLSWSPDGATVFAGGARSGSAWRVGRDGGRVSLGASLLGLRQVARGSAGPQALFSDTPSTRLVIVDYTSGKVAGTKWVSGPGKPGKAAVSLPVPYIHQVNDTASTADGNWACGPTSLAMTLAYYGKIEPWSRTEEGRAQAAQNNMVAMSLPEAGPPSGLEFAPYVTNQYTLYGKTYSATARDPRGRPVAGLYGTICPTGLADWQTMVSVIGWHGLKSQYVPATWEGIVGALKRGHPVMMGNALTPEGHILLVVGYTNDGNLIVNDPYGDKFAPGYGTNNGHGVLYPWKRATARRALEVTGVWPPPTATPTITPTATATPTHAATSTPTAAPPTVTPTPTETPALLAPPAP